MTSAEYLRRDVRVAGVPWPAYKLAALAVGFAVLVLVGVVAASASAAVLTAAAAATAVWLALGPLRPHRR